MIVIIIWFKFNGWTRLYVLLLTSETTHDSGYHVYVTNALRWIPRYVTTFFCISKVDRIVGVPKNDFKNILNTATSSKPT